jgi:outer membrane usher protein FimD/PapC
MAVRCKEVERAFRRREAKDPGEHCLDAQSNVQRHSKHTDHTEAALRSTVPEAAVEATSEIDARRAALASAARAAFLALRSRPPA